MEAEIINGPTVADLDEFDRLFGPPPLLSTESCEAYRELTLQVLRAVRPTDIIEKSNVRRMVDGIWSGNRYCRFKSLSLNEKAKQRLKFQAERARLAAERREAIQRTKEQPAEKPENELDVDCSQMEIAEQAKDDVDLILSQATAERHHVQALQDMMEFHDRLDWWQHAASRSSDEALRLTAEYRKRSSPRNDAPREDIIEAEIVESKAEQPQIDSTQASGKTDDV